VTSIDLNVIVTGLKNQSPSKIRKRKWSNENSRGSTRR